MCDTIHRQKWKKYGKIIYMKIHIATIYTELILLNQRHYNQIDKSIARKISNMYIVGIRCV